MARQAAKLAGAGARVAAASRAAKVCARSFSPETAVATPDGIKAIGAVQEGDQVEAYDPATGAASVQTVEHVWINHDDDLIDLILRADDAGSSSDGAGERKQQQVAVAAHGAHAPPAASESQQGGAGDTSAANAETIHTTAKHPWLTADRGWVLAGELRPGERVVRLDGTTATLASVQVVPGAATMYNLQVSQLHTFAVGAGQYIVHNCGGGLHFVDTNVLVHAAEHGSAAAQAQIQRGSTYITRGVLREFLDVNTSAQASSRAQWLARSGIQLFRGRQASAAARSPAF